MVPSAARAHVTGPCRCVVEALSLGLADRGLPCSPASWPPGDPDPLGVLLVEVGDDRRRATWDQAVRAVSRWPAPVVVQLAGASRARAGGLLAAGAVDVLDPAAPLNRLVATLLAATAREPTLHPLDRQALVAAWEVERTTLLDLERRMGSLTSKERTVLERLHAGMPVPEIAESLGAARSTVRSQVRAVLDKLRVRSQLGAVAAYEHWCSWDLGAHGVPALPAAGPQRVPGSGRG